MRVLSDLRYAVRGLIREPYFAAAAVVSLTLGIATATTVFSLLNAAILRPPPFDEANRLALLNITQHSKVDGLIRHRWSWPRFRLLGETLTSFEEVASSSNAVVTMTGGGDPEPVPVEIVSARYFSMLRAPVALGRTFADAAPFPAAPLPAQDQESAATPVAILSSDLWRSRFDAANDVVGKVVELNGVALTVIGVMGDGFAGVSGLARAWIPATIAPQATYRDYLTTNQNFITVVGRFRDGVTMAAANAELAVAGKRIHEVNPSEADAPDDRFAAMAMSLNDARVDVVTRRALVLLTAAVGVLLLIACANVASLLLGRAASRRREIAVRLAIGAGRPRLVRQLLLESGVLAAVAAVLGLMVSAWAMATIRIPPTLSRGRNFYGAIGEFATPAMDWRVLGFAIATSVVTVVLFGLVPALRATRTDLVSDLKDASRHENHGRHISLRDAVVALQVTLSVVLMGACGLLLTSYARLRETPIGFDPTNVLTFMIRPSEVKYPPNAAPAFLDRVLGEVERVAGVESVTVDGCAPLTMQCARAALHIVGRQWPTQNDAPIVLRHYVAPSHFSTLGVPIVRGRGLTAADGAGRPHVVVINQRAADRFWPNEDPIGRRVWFDGAAAFGSADSSAEIVGIVGNVAHQPLDEEPIQPDFFTPYAQFTYPTRVVLLRARGDPVGLVPEIARAVQRADPGLALFDVQTMNERARLSQSKHTFQTIVFVVVAGVALVLAITGVYAVTAHFVAARTREIGVRMALGASDAQIVGASLRHTIRLGLAGGIAGVLVTVGLSQVVRAMLYETSPLEPRAYVGALVVLALAVLVATYVPVRRALKVNPAKVLRGE